MGRGYLIANVRFEDPGAAREYGQRVLATVEMYGGRYLARGGPVELAEGTWQLGYVTLVEFPSLDAANRWYESTEYAEIKPLRMQAAQSEIAFVEGLDHPA